MDQLEKVKKKLDRYTRLFSASMCSFPPFFLIAGALHLGILFMLYVITFIILFVFSAYKMMKVRIELDVSIEEKYKDGATKEDAVKIKKWLSFTLKKSVPLVFGSLAVFGAIFFFPYNPDHDWIAWIVAMTTIILCSLGINDMYKGIAFSEEETYIESVRKRGAGNGG